MANAIKKKDELRKKLKSLRGRREKHIKRVYTTTAQEFETGHGPVRIRLFRGKQPFVSSRKEDFKDDPSGKYISSKYADLDPGFTTAKEFLDLFAKKRKAKPIFKNRRAALLRGIVMGAENSEARFLGADKIVRAAIRRAKKQKSDDIFRDVFVGSASEPPLFSMAMKGGSRSIADFANGHGGLTAKQMGAMDEMSDVSDGEEGEI